MSLYSFISVNGCGLSRKSNYLTHQFCLDPLLVSILFYIRPCSFTVLHLKNSL